MAKIEEATKKPHPFSKEGRALRAQKEQAQMESKQEPKVVEPKKNDSMDLILERLNKLEQENKELKEQVWPKENKFKKAREHYKWPRVFNYRLWGTVPILSAESFRKDPTKDLLYKNSNWVWITNHFVKLKLANGETQEVVVDDYNRDFVRSEKLQAKDQNGNIITEENLKYVQSYTFNTKEYWEITVLSSVIN